MYVHTYIHPEMIATIFLIFFRFFFYNRFYDILAVRMQVVKKGARRTCVSRKHAKCRKIKAGRNCSMLTSVKRRDVYICTYVFAFEKYTLN